MNEKCHIATISACWALLGVIVAWWVHSGLRAWWTLCEGGWGTDKFLPSWCGTALINRFTALLNIGVPVLAIVTIILLVVSGSRNSKLIHGSLSFIVLSCIATSLLVFGHWFLGELRQDLSDHPDPHAVELIDEFTLSKQVWWIP